MSPKELLRKLIAARWSIINQHEEIDETDFSVTGTIIHDRNGKRYDFDFHSAGEIYINPNAERGEKHYVLDLIEKN